MGCNFEFFMSLLGEEYFVFSIFSEFFRVVLCVFFLFIKIFKEGCFYLKEFFIIYCSVGGKEWFYFFLMFCCIVYIKIIKGRVNYCI